MASEKLFYIIEERKGYNDINVNLEIKAFYKRSFLLIGLVSFMHDTIHLRAAANPSP